jgi:hypothetical protein
LPNSSSCTDQSPHFYPCSIHISVNNHYVSQYQSLQDLSKDQLIERLLKYENRNNNEALKSTPDFSNNVTSQSEFSSPQFDSTSCEDYSLSCDQSNCSQIASEANMGSLESFDYCTEGFQPQKPYYNNLVPIIPAPTPAKVYTCLWKNCYARFGAFEQLTSHITAIHIGTGKVFAYSY